MDNIDRTWGLLAKMAKQISERPKAKYREGATITWLGNKRVIEKALFNESNIPEKRQWFYRITDEYKWGWISEERLDEEQNDI